MKNVEIYKLIKQNEKLLNLLRFYKDIDKSELSRRLKLSMPTIYKSVDDLSNVGIMKKSTNLSLNNDYGILVGISIGTSLCKIVFLGHDFQLLSSDIFSNYKEVICKKIRKDLDDDQLLKNCLNKKDKKYIYFKTPKTFANLKNILDKIFECLKFWIENINLNILSIGISCTGIVNNKNQIIIDAYNLKYLSNSTLDSLIFPDKQSFFSKHNVHISLVQNSNASVISEKIYLNQINSQYKKNKNIIALYLGVGIGAGIYLNKLYEGTNGHSGEVGHTKAPIFDIEQDNKEYIKRLISEGKIDGCCTCKCKDCYDYKIRSYVFEKTANEFYDMSADKIREYLIANPIKAKILGEYFGNIINNISNWLDIDLIIFTGKIYKSMDLLLNHIDSIRDENSLKFNRNDCSICVSDYGSLAPSIGAAIYAYHKKYDLELSWNY